MIEWLNTVFANHSLSSQVLWISLTIALYFLALQCHKIPTIGAWLHPIVVTTFFILLLLSFSLQSITDYEQHVYLLNWLLGPATVALAVPVYRYFPLIQQAGIKALLVILIGGISGPAIACLVLYIAGSPMSLKLSVLTKSITTPLAMDTATVIGANASLAAGIVIITGVVGVSFCGPLFRWFNISHVGARGLALGTACHAIGTAHAAKFGDKMAAFATVALCVNGISTALLLPIIIALLSSRIG